MEVLLTLWAVISFVWILKLQGKIDRMSGSHWYVKDDETEIEEAGDKGFDRYAPVATKAESEVVEFIETPIQEPLPPREPIDWEQWLTRKFFPIAGSVSLLIAIVYFLVLAISNDWIGPREQVGLGILGSVILLGLGEWLRPRYPQFFSYLSATGVAGLILITFVARGAYDMISAPQSLALYIVAITIGALLAIRYDKRELANLSILGGLIAPLLTNTATPDPVGLMGFLFMLSLGGFFISLHKRWPELLGLLLVGVTFFEFLIFGVSGYEVNPTLILFLVYGIAILLGVAGLARTLWHREDHSETPIDALVLAGSMLLANIFAHQIFQHQGWDNFGFFVLLQGFLFLGLSTWSRHQGLHLYSQFSLLGALASILFATIWELRGSQEIVLSLVLSIEALVLAWCSRWQQNDYYHVFAAVAAILAVFFTFQVSGIWWSLLAVIFNSAALLGVAHIYDRSEGDLVIKFLASGLASFMIFWWNGDLFMDLVANNDWKTVWQVIVPSLWTLALLGLSHYTQKVGYFVTALASLGFIHLFSWPEFDAQWLTAGVRFVITIGLSIITAFVALRGQHLAAWRHPIAWILIGLSAASVLFYGVQSLEEPLRTFFWLATGLATLAVGLNRDWPQLRHAGLAVIVLVIAKLYLVDIWQWEIWMRFVAFFALGIALLGVAFNYQKWVKDK